MFMPPPILIQRLSLIRPTLIIFFYPVTNNQESQPNR